MERVFSVDDIPWADLKGLPGARGFEFKALTNDAYTKAYSCELVRLEPGDHSVPHVEPWSHLLYILSGTGDVTRWQHRSNPKWNRVPSTRGREALAPQSW
jgi:hypothetical protein